MTKKRWTVEVFIDEDGGRTYAEARLYAGYNTGLCGLGRAKPHPADCENPAIGDELATARALADLGHRLLVNAASDIGAATNERVVLTR